MHDLRISMGTVCATGAEPGSRATDPPAPQPDAPAEGPYTQGKHVRALVADYAPSDPEDLIALYADASTRGRCLYCGLPLKGYLPVERRWIPLDGMEGQITYDHILPAAHGCPKLMGALVLSCKSCNMAKGDTPYDEWIRSPQGRRSCKDVDPEDLTSTIEERFVHRFWDRTPEILRHNMSTRSRVPLFQLGDFLREVVTWTADHPEATVPPSVEDVLGDLQWWPLSVETLYGESRKDDSRLLPAKTVFDTVAGLSYDGMGVLVDGVVPSGFGDLKGPPSSVDLNRRLIVFLDGLDSTQSRSRWIASLSLAFGLALGCASVGGERHALNGGGSLASDPDAGGVPALGHDGPLWLSCCDGDGFRKMRETLTGDPSGWSDETVDAACRWFRALDVFDGHDGSYPTSGAGGHVMADVEIRTEPGDAVDHGGPSRLSGPMGGDDDRVSRDPMDLTGDGMASRRPGGLGDADLPGWLLDLRDRYLEAWTDVWGLRICDGRTMIETLLPALVEHGASPALGVGGVIEDDLADPVVVSLVEVLCGECCDGDGELKTYGSMGMGRLRRVRGLITAFKILAPRSYETVVGCGLLADLPSAG